MMNEPPRPVSDLLELVENLLVARYGQRLVPEHRRLLDAAFLAAHERLAAERWDAAILAAARATAEAEAAEAELARQEEANRLAREVRRSRRAHRKAQEAEHRAREAARHRPPPPRRNQPRRGNLATVAAVDDASWAAARAAAVIEGTSVYVWLGRLVESAPWSNLADLELGPADDHRMRQVRIQLEDRTASWPALKAEASRRRVTTARFLGALIEHAVDR